MHSLNPLLPLPTSKMQRENIFIPQFGHTLDSGGVWSQ